MARLDYSPKVKKLLSLELTKLKFHTTQKERNKLNHYTLNPNDFRDCLYSQLTGDARSERAVKLLNECAVPYSWRVNVFIKPSYSDFNGRLTHADSDFSVLECVLVRNPSFAKKAIRFLKSENTIFTI
jgi:hypothetical protein